MLLHKNIGVSGIKVLDEDEGIVECFVSGIGNKDSVGDIIQPGAFVDSLAHRTPKGVWSHDWSRPVSRTLAINEVGVGDPSLPAKMKAAGIGGLYVRTQFNLETQDGKDAFSNVKFFGEESEWSIGYQVVESSYDKEKKALLLQKIELFEYSPVLFGANSLTATVSVKVALPDGEEVVVQVHGASTDDAEKITEAVHASLKAGNPALNESTSEEEKMSGTSNDAAAPVGDEQAPAEDEVSDLKSLVEAAIAIHESDDTLTEEAKSGLVSFVKANTEVPVREKAVPGSYEERYDRLYEALKDAAGESGYAYPVATFDSSVVYYTYDWRSGESATYQASYEIDDEGNIKLGDPTEVELVEVIVAKAAVDALEAKGIEVKDLDTEALAKAGRVLSKGNRAKIEDAADALKAVLDADSKSEDDDVKDAAVEGEKSAEGGDAKDDDAPKSEDDGDEASAEGAEDENDDESDTDDEKTFESVHIFVPVGDDAGEKIEDLDDDAKALIDGVVKSVVSIATEGAFEDGDELVVLGLSANAEDGLITLSYGDNEVVEVSYEAKDDEVTVTDIKAVEEEAEQAPAALTAEELAEAKALMDEAMALATT
jgi:HK97 family phage prohead protease